MNTQPAPRRSYRLSKKPHVVYAPDGIRHVDHAGTDAARKRESDIFSVVSKIHIAAHSAIDAITSFRAMDDATRAAVRERAREILKSLNPEWSDHNIERAIQTIAGL